jgi:hypothetical protein
MQATRARLRAKLDAKLGKEVVEERDRHLKQEFIDEILKRGKQYKYVREMTRQEVADEYPECLPILDSKLHGREMLVEYHLFTMFGEIPMIRQRRW